MKRAILFILIICLIGTAAIGEASPTTEALEPEAAAQPGDEAAYTERVVKVITNGEEAGELALRFYEPTPNVPYMGMAEYIQYVIERPLTLRENDDGTCALVNEAGVEILCDADADVITAPDWNGFCDLPYPLEDKAVRWKDSNTHFVRVVNVTYEGEPRTVVFDFAKYGIGIYSDGNDIYLPVSTLSNLMTDTSTVHMLYNGDKLFVQPYDPAGYASEGLYDAGWIPAESKGQDRPADIIRQSYADICFNFDFFFGHPGVAELDDEIASVGLDQALTDLGEPGESIKRGLHSKDIGEYISAMYRLFFEYLSDGHTFFNPVGVSENFDFDDSLSLSLWMILSLAKDPVLMRQNANIYIPMQRAMIWGDENYMESGQTAIIRLDSFMPDEGAWDSYYRGEGEIPEDCLGIVKSGLEKASENPEIRNVVFDLSANGGGSSDVLMAILALTTGQNQLYGVNKLTGQSMLLTYETDANFDGVYDERDREARYDFNYGVLTTRCAFSCGNLFPFLMQDAGAVVIGEPTSGGSCVVQIGSDAEGLTYMMSSAQWVVRDREGGDVEQGCRVDLPIDVESDSASLGIAGMWLNVYGEESSYSAYFDADRLDAMMNEWFE